MVVLCRAIPVESELISSGASETSVASTSNFSLPNTPHGQEHNETPNSESSIISPLVSDPPILTRVSSSSRLECGLDNLDAHLAFQALANKLKLEKMERPLSHLEAKILELIQNGDVKALAELSRLRRISSQSLVITKCHHLLHRNCAVQILMCASSSERNARCPEW